ncbi:Hsp20/alpha crystallin family protein [Methanococcoides methylutens]|uniref:Hsp20/alpha crystallin family protein n=1 Tax=Methanococcoides methylutens MM1 TaxID=1434104 RepID=A0A0E3X1E8_METMT|nr:Hsp20/alpha crystallin family protein [Methanococcoides methylutens]AKB85170.1 hsp20/alpha crystallin family protein [Methanococcoides methylutens MM1]
MTEKEHNDDGSVPLPMKELEEIVRSLIERIMDDMADEGFEKPAFYGFSVVYNGPDKAEEHTFSSIKVDENDFYVSKKGPVVECTEIDDKLHVTVDTGVEAEDVRFSASGSELDLQFETEEEVFTHHIELEPKVDPESSVMTCKNGIVEIVFRIADE